MARSHLFTVRARFDENSTCNWAGRLQPGRARR